MSTLAFLHADPAAGGAPPRSPLAAETEAAAVGGVATATAESAACRERVGWADASLLGKLELQGPADELDRLRAASGFEAPAAGQHAGLGAAGGVHSPAAGLAARGDTGWWCPLTPTRALLLCDDAAALAPLREGAGTAALDVSAQYAALTLAGPLARETFARFCALDLRPSVMPVGAVRPGSIARMPGLVVRESEERYLMLFGAAYASYAWEVVADAGTRLGGRAVDAGALPPIVARTEVESHA